MTPEKQRIAIAEACGWGLNYDWERPGIGEWWEKTGEQPRRSNDLPDYLNDLNAMHEAEMVLNATQLVAYVKHLAAIHPTFCVDVLDDRDPDGDWHYEMSFLITATAAQRAEAFLRTIGKWEASK